MKLLIFVLAALTVMFLVGARTGTIDIPGLSPVKKKTAAAAIYSSDTETATAKEGASASEDDAKKADLGEADATPSQEEVASKEPQTKPESEVAASSTPEKASSNAQPPPAIAAKPPPKSDPKLDVDPVAGQRKLATVWQKLDPAAILQIVDKWKDEDLALQLSVMPEKQVGEILSQMKPARASALSLRIQRIAQDQARKEAEDKAKAGV